MLKVYNMSPTSFLLSPLIRLFHCSYFERGRLRLRFHSQLFDATCPTVFNLVKRECARWPAWWHIDFILVQSQLNAEVIYAFVRTMQVFQQSYELVLIEIFAFNDLGEHATRGHRGFEEVLGGICFFRKFTEDFSEDFSDTDLAAERLKVI